MNILKYKSIIVMIVCLISNYISAQNKDISINNNLNITVGMNNGNLKDVNFSPLNYSHSGMVFGLEYQKVSNKNKFSVSVDYYNSMLETEASTYFDSDLTIVNLKTSYLWNLNTNNNKLHLYLGGEFHANVNYINYNDKDAYSFLAAYSLKLKSSITYNFNDKHRLNSSVGIPFITLLVQPPYNGFDEQLQENEDQPLKLLTDGEIALPNNYLAVNWDITYSVNISKRFTPLIKYQFNYQEASKSHTFKQVQNQIVLGLNYKF